MKFSLFALPIIAISLFLIGLCGTIFSSPDYKINSSAIKTISLETPKSEAIELEHLNKNESLNKK